MRWSGGTGRPAVSAALGAPAPGAAPASAVGAAGCVMSWQRSPAGVWRCSAGPRSCSRGRRGGGGGGGVMPDE